MKIIKYPERKLWSEILKRPALNYSDLETTVSMVLEDVNTNGDAALIKYTEKFDGVKLHAFEVSEEEFVEADKLVDEKLKKAIKVASENIRKFHNSQEETGKKIKTSSGIECWRKSVAIQKVGLYIPGGSAPLFSTLLMLAIPAKIAGCAEIILCTPPNKEGKVNPVILYAANSVGVKRIFKVGGVQAIGAMAYGTKSVPQVYKIFGPGNQYVTCAKQMIQKSGVAIDMPAGPSEVAVFADETCVPAFVAADLLSQAEHGADSHVILVSTSEAIVEAVTKEINVQIEKLSRKELAQKALLNSKAIIVSDESEAMDLLNEYAPEHLILACTSADELADKVINAGSVFLGNYSCESAGDYASGTNHTLPTNGYAKAYSGVSLDSFVKKITFQKITEAGIKKLGPTIEIMAEAEGLDAHKNAVTIRLNP